MKPGDRIIVLRGNDILVAVVGHDQDWTAYELKDLPVQGASPCAVGEMVEEVTHYGDKFGEVESYRQFPQFLFSNLRYRP